MRKGRLDVVVSGVVVVALLLTGVVVQAPRASAVYAPPPPPEPVPTVPSSSLGASDRLSTSPSPDDLPPDEEEARAGEAVRAVLEKYLRYWGPRYQAAPIEVTVAGEWAHGVAQWQSEARTLSGPIHVLARRLPDGTWQALLPSTDGQYLQWLDAMPERLVPASQKGQLRIEATEADAVRPLQASPAVPPAVTATPPTMESPARPTPTPTPEVFQGILGAEPEGYVVLYSDGDAIHAFEPSANRVQFIGSDVPVPDSLLSSATKHVFTEDACPGEVSTTDGYEFRHGIVSPNQDHVLYLEAKCDHLRCEPRFNVWLLNVQSGDLVLLFNDTTGPRELLLDPIAWSSLTGEVIFDSWAPETGSPFQGLWTYSLTEQGLSRLDLGPGGYNGRVWLSPNEEYLLFPGYDAGGADRLPSGVGTPTNMVKVFDVRDRRVVASLRDSVSGEYFIRGWASREDLPGIERLCETRGPESEGVTILSVPEATSGFQRPMANDHYGWEWLEWTGSVYHPGDDYNGPGAGNADCGTDIHAVANGTVRYVNTGSWGGLVIEHVWQGITVYSQYGHVATSLVSTGQNVSKGQHIAEMGNVGADTCHLHWEVRESDHPQPTNGSYWSTSVLRDLSSVNAYYEDPEWWVDNHGAYSTSHLECVSNWCTRVSGAGSDQCSPENSYCGPSSGRWHAKYFDNQQCQDPNCSTTPRCEEDFDGPFIDKYWGGADAPCGMGGDNWGALFTGRFNFSGANYVFHIDHDDGARLFLDGQCIQEVWNNTGLDHACPARYLSGEHDVAVAFRENGGDAKLHLWWDTDASPCQPQLPSAPTLLSPSNGATFNEGQSITLSWSATGNEYYGEVGGGPGGTLTFGWQSGTSKNLGSQWAGYAYSWRVKARNSAGDSGWSSMRTFTVKPAAPSNLSAQAASCSQVDLYWDDKSGNEEGYKIYRNGSYVGQVGMDTRTYQDTGLGESTGYSYYVKAFRGSIVSDASNTVNITTPACPPPQPDLRPYAKSGYPYPVVPSSVQGTHDVNTLHAGQPTFFDWYFINGGNATASGSFHVELWVDSIRYVRYPYSDYFAGRIGGFNDWMETVSAPGWHTVRLITDPDDTIAESDETNNVWEREFYWAPSAPYSDDMESGTNEWAAAGLWHQVHGGSPYGESHSGSHSWWYGQDSTGDYETGSANSGDLTSPSIYVPTTGYYLRFWYRYETETQGLDWDTRWVQISVDGGPFSDVLQLRDDPMNWWLQSPAIDLSGYAGHTVQVRFRFDTIDDSFNDYRGWYIDDFDISSTPPPSCADAHEPNDGSAQSTTIAYGQILSADICPGGDYDFYRFSGSAGDRVVVDIDAKVDGSSLDSYVLLLDSDGTTVLAEHDDEVLGEVQDSLLGYYLPHDGTYYIKVRAWNHPSVGGTDYSYTMHLFTDNTDPSWAEIVSPVNEAWLDPTLQTISASATDNQSGINRVEFLWHDADWENSDWIWLGADQDGRDGWSLDFDTSSLSEQRGGAFYIWAFDWVGNWTGAGSWTLGIDRTPPTAFIDVSPMYGDAPFVDFWVWWGASDNLSGISTYDVQSRLGSGGTWIELFTDTLDTSNRFVGVDGNTYYFRVRARDQAGNLGDYTDGSASYTVQLCPVPPDGYEADDARISSNRITTDGISQTHNFHAEADEDWVGFIAFAGHAYTLATTNIGGHADTVLYLYASDGTTLVDWNDDDPDNWPASRLEWYPSLSGVYYIMVNHWDEYGYGCVTEYGLSVSSDVGATHQTRFPLALRS